MPHNSRNNPSKSPNNYKHTHIKPKEELLKVQVEKWSALLKEALVSLKTASEKKDLNEIVDKGRGKICRILREDEKRERIRGILSKDKNLERRWIVWDFVAYDIKELWKDKILIRFITNYWLKVDLDADTNNLNRFLDYCSIHSFIPMFDRIIINWEYVSEINGINSILNCKISSWHWSILNSLYNELNREYESRPDIKPALEQILPWIDKFLGYRDSIYQYLFGKRLQKLKQTGSISERVFAEAARRIEPKIIESIWINSTGAKICSYDDDHGREADLYFKLRKLSSYHNIREILTQLTMISDDKELAQKEKKVEGYLHMRLISDNDYIDSEDKHNFILLSVNWEFEKNAQIINEKYKEWRNSPLEREKSWKISLFVDTIDPEYIKPAEVIYIALNMLYKKINFKLSSNDEYLKICNNTWVIFEKNTKEINWIKLNRISIDSAEVTKLKYKWDHPNWHDLLKHKYSISYDWIKMWTIVVYWM